MDKTSFAKASCALALMALSSAAVASVLHTKHNFSATNTGGAINGGFDARSGGPDGQHTTNTTEICVFCHTPHGADQTAYAPLWNRMQTSASFTRFSNLNRWSFDSQEAPVGSVSIACLSCHDGTQAVGTLINTAGSDTNTTGYSMSEFVTMSSLDAPDGPLFGGARATTFGDMIYIGTDLSNDHPISMQYGGGGITDTAPTNATADDDFAQAAATLTAGFPGGLDPTFFNGVTLNDTPGGYPSQAGPNNSNHGNVNGSGTGVVNHDNGGNGSISDRWWIDANGLTGFQNAGDMPLYARAVVFSKDGTTIGTSSVIQPTVECGTCHDPHSGNTTFLRIPGNNNSQVCLTCHAK
jgi:predicted CXXCH cytochrome family protein